MCYFLQCFFALTLLLLTIADPLFENDNMNGPVPDAIPLEPYLEAASSMTTDQFRNDLTLNQPGDYPDPDVVPFDVFLPDCTTPPHTNTLCCTRLPLTSPERYIIQFYSMIRGDNVVYGCTKCTPVISNLYIWMTEKSAP